MHTSLCFYFHTCIVPKYEVLVCKKNMHSYAFVYGVYLVLPIFVVMSDFENFGIMNHIIKMSLKNRIKSCLSNTKSITTLGSSFNQKYAFSLTKRFDKYFFLLLADFMQYLMLIKLPTL